MPLFTSEYVFSDDYPTIEPSLKLDFANARALDPRITFTRASTATYVGRDGLIKTAGKDEARFDHDPATGESLGLLIEESRTNLQADNVTTFNLSNVSRTLNATTAPDGSNGAISVDGNAGTSVKYTYDSYGTTNTGTYTASIFLKYKSEQNVVVRINDNTGVNDTRQVVNIQNGTLTGSPTNGGTATGAKSSITAYPNGWYRVSVTCTFNDAITQLQAPSVLLTGYTSTATTNGVYLWGAQLEAGFFPTSYIPTSGATATRAKDVPVISGTSFSNFYNSSEGSIVVRYNINGYYATDGYNRIFEISDGTPNNRITPLLNQTQQVIYEAASIAGTNELTYNTTSISFGPFYTWVAGYKQNDFQRYSTDVNGNIDTNSDNTLNVGNLSVNQLNLGHQGDSAIRQLNGHLAYFYYYPKRLTNAQLQTLTQ